jgi:uncharacterized protein YhbP (UPF0306 family)
MTDDQQLKRLALELINQQSTMTLATARDSVAWAAPVYYVLYKSAFFFFSDPSCRHIAETLASGQAAAAIYPVADTWQGIRGIQMSGGIRQLTPGLTAVQAIRAYTRKFAFTREFFEPGQALNLENFVKRFKVRFYRFDPRLIYYLDNQIKFGFRSEIKLD